MTDEDRVRLATRSGAWMLGPVERERCQKHKTRWRTFRWMWPVDGDISSSEPDVIRSCEDCIEEDRHADDE